MKKAKCLQYGAWAMALALMLPACSRNNESNNNNGMNSGGEDMAQTEDMGSTPEDMAEGGDMPTGDADMATSGLEIPEGCNPIAFEKDCLFPYPSNVFLTEDSETPSGFRVKLTNTARLKARKVPIDLMNVHPVDGFSHHQPIMAYFNEELDDSSLVFHDADPTPTTLPDSVTILIEADTGEAVAHWAEVERQTKNADERVLAIRTFSNLKHETRYVVAIQNLNNVSGEPVVTPQGFKQIRDKEAMDHPVLGPLTERYDAEIFPILTEHGVERANVQLAWDFTTGSREFLQRDMLHMRADLMQKLEANPPKVTVTNFITDTGREEIAARLEGTIEVPLYLKNTEVFAGLNRGADGLPEANGTHEFPFTLQIPVNAVPENGDFEPRRIMQYGHGFFGAREEINYNFMRGFSNEQQYITASVDWWGMQERDLAQLALKLTTDSETAILFLDDVHQGMMNFIALSYALKTTIPELDELKYFDKLIYDPEHLYYYGISQGHILGGTFLALSPHIEHAVFSVGGAPFSFMMSRSNNFTTFLLLIRTSFEGDLDVQKFMTLSQHSFDRIDPSTWAANILEDPLPDTPEDRDVLVQFGLWDHSVPSLATMNHIRMMGVPVLQPSPMDIYGTETIDGTVDGSAAVIVDFNLADPPGIYSQPPTDAQLEELEQLNVHEAVRRNEKIKEQIDGFLQVDGVIEHTCDGPCDPE